MDLKKAFQKVLVGYKNAWEKRNPALAIKIFTEDATYSEDPFDEKPARGHAQILRYWEEAVARQRNISFNYRKLYAGQDPQVCGAEWTAKYTKTENGETNLLKGVLFCRLTKDGKKIEKFWEYWHLKGGKPSFTWREVREKTV